VRKKRLAPGSGAIHIFVLAQMRDVGYDGARIHGHLFPHAIVHNTDRRLQAKHTRLPLTKERDGDGHPELDVPLVLADFRVRPIFLHDDPERWVKHFIRLRKLLWEAGALEAGRKHWNRVCLGREAALICMRRALDFDRLNRWKVDRCPVVRQNQDARPCVQGATRST
jgi:hypothetical protein